MSNKSYFPIIFLAMLTAFSYQKVLAQANPDLSKEIEVVKAFQPTITDAIKILPTPRISDTASYIPTFNYQIKSMSISTEKTINRLPSVPLGSAPKPGSHTGFVRVAGGNAFTPMAEFFLNTTPTKNSEFGMQLFHFSSKPKVLLNSGIKERAPFSSNLASIFAKNYFRKTVLEWDANFQRERFDYYGFPNTDSLLYRENKQTSTTLGKKQVFNQASTNLRLSNFSGKTKTDYQLALHYDYFWNATGQHAHKGELDAKFKAGLNHLNLNSGAIIAYYNQNMNQYESDSSTHQYLFAAIDPQIAFSGKLWEARIGLNLAMIFDKAASYPFHISPKTYFSFTPISDILTLFVGTDGKIVPNSYISSVRANPYLHYDIDLKPTETQLLIYGGVKGKFGQRISYLLDVNYSIVKDELVYFQKLTNFDNQMTVVGNTFNVAYEALNALKFGGLIRYSSSGFSLSLHGNYYHYNSKTYTVMVNKPVFDAGLQTEFDVTGKLSARLGTSVIGPRNAAIETTQYTIDSATGLFGNAAATWSYPVMKAIIDTHLEVNYQFNKQLGFFISVNNILNRNHEKWYGYNQPGLLVLGGIRFVF